MTATSSPDDHGLRPGDVPHAHRLDVRGPPRHGVVDDVLIGLVAGVALQVVGGVLSALPGWIGQPLIPPSIGFRLGLRDLTIRRTGR